MLARTTNAPETPEPQGEIRETERDQSQPIFSLSINETVLTLSYEELAKLLWPRVVEGWYDEKAKIEPTALTAARPFVAKKLRKDGVDLQRGQDALDILIREMFKKMLTTLVHWDIAIETDSAGHFIDGKLKLNTPELPGTGES